MRSRVLDNGYIIQQAKSPLGNGHVYYVKGGVEGMVQVIDTFMIPPSVISACLAWEMDHSKVECFKDPTCEFNKRVVE